MAGFFKACKQCELTGLADAYFEVCPKCQGELQTYLEYRGKATWTKTNN